MVRLKVDVTYQIHPVLGQPVVSSIRIFVRRQCQAHSQDQIRMSGYPTAD